MFSSPLDKYQVGHYILRVRECSEDGGSQKSVKLSVNSPSWFESIHSHIRVRCKWCARLSDKQKAPGSTPGTRTYCLDGVMDSTAVFGTACGGSNPSRGVFN